MPQFNKRGKRGLKRITSKQKFGVRYLHQHMFKDEGTSDEDSIRDVDHIPEKTDGRFCFVRAASAIMILVGVAFALVGALVKRHPVNYRVGRNGAESPMDDAIQYNSMLDAFVLVGGVLMMLGAIMLAAVQIFVCYPRRKLGTKKPRAKDPEGFLYPEKTSESEVAARKLEKVPVFALVHKVQPKKKEEPAVVSKPAASKPAISNSSSTAVKSANEERSAAAVFQKQTSKTSFDESKQQ